LDVRAANEGAHVAPRLTSADRRVVALLAASAVWAGCSASDAERGQSNAALTVPVPAVTQFAILASRTVNIGDRSAVTGGDIGIAAGVGGAQSSLTGGIDSRVGVGEVVLAQVVTLRDRAQAGEIGANQINVSPGVITGPRSAFVAPPAAPVPGTFTVGTNAVTVNGGQTSSLAPGKHGVVTVNGTLNLSGGLYEIRSLQLGVDARVTALARSTVRVLTGISAADRARILPAAALRAGDLRLIVAGTIDTNNNSVSLGTDNQLTAIVVARNTFRSADRLVAAGAIAAQDVLLGNDNRLAFNTGFGCGSNASCNDNNSCTVDVCTDTVCSASTAPNGTACSDSNACTRTDTCQAGVCLGANPVTCTASDQCHVAGVCAPATGICSNPPRPNGTACNDSNACTGTDTCQAGACVGANPVVCAAAGPCRAPGTCSPATGVCSNPPGPDGTPCSDGNACTQADACVSGACMGGAPVVCTASGQCRGVGTCSPATGVCSDPPGPDGTPCTDGNACTQADACVSGACASGAPVTCTASGQCRGVGTCDPASGTCSDPPGPDGASCSDGNACTQVDSCAAGACVGASPVTCTASDQCHAAGVCSPATGTCSNPPSPDGTSCDDGDVCSHTDACLAGTCTGGGSIVTEYPAGVVQPASIVSTGDGNLWFISPEMAPGAFNGSVGRISAATGAVTTFLAGYRLHDLARGADGSLWVAQQAPGGLSAIGQITSAGVFLPPLVGLPADKISVAADGSVWFASSGGGLNLAGSFLPSSGVITNFLVVSNAPRSMTVGPDGNIWMTESNGGAAPALVARITPAGALTELTVPTTGDLNVITSGPDGNLWFTDAGRNEIGRVSADGTTIAKFAVPTPASGLYGITTGPDGNLWFTERNANRIGRITPTGLVTELACIPTAGSGPSSITAGPDGRLWLTESTAANIASVRVP
jgi:streptogramin lyase